MFERNAEVVRELHAQGAFPKREGKPTPDQVLALMDTKPGLWAVWLAPLPDLEHGLIVALSAREQGEIRPDTTDIRNAIEILNGNFFTATTVDIRVGRIGDGEFPRIYMNWY